MTGYVSPPSDGRDGDTFLEFFEQELVTALNDFANASPAPHFDATGIKSRARRKRAGFIAAVAAVLIVGGGSTALATVGSGSQDARPAATHATATKTKNTDKGNVTTVPFVKPFDLRGVSLASAKEALANAGLKLGTVTHGAIDNCTPGSVIAVSPLSPTILYGGETVDLGLCG
ncbi:PASTA domain-containing protein [Streptomyces sp. NBC_01262]|uniref:PASTA domain-containing protein n=1 Tax=Streptomyces sp. NBC_01262 TaxID=2903803 RepID=UPI002E32FBEA|nr:PASTA domain-containing protein [Streptomyces sp. NBC_01262]